MQQPSGADESTRVKGASQHTITEADIEEEQEKIASYEAAFKEIKEATGVADVNEVIQKFITQEETHKNLQAMTRESQTKIDALIVQKMAVQVFEHNKNTSFCQLRTCAGLFFCIQERVQRLKFSVSPDEQSANVTTHADRKYERQRLKYERLTKVLVSVKAGIQHLSERLEGVKLDEAPLVSDQMRNVENLKLTVVLTQVLTDENMVEVLQQCEQRLRIVLEAIRQEEEALVRDMGEAALQRNSSLPMEPPVVNNYRVKDAEGVDEAPSEEEFEEVESVCYERLRRKLSHYCVLASF